MSSYCDAFANVDRSSSNRTICSGCNRPEHRLKSLCLDQLVGGIRERTFTSVLNFQYPKPHDSHADRSERTIFAFCFILMIVYLKLMCVSYPMINDVYSKDEYFCRELQLERDNIERQKGEYKQIIDDLRSQYNPNETCRRCFSAIYRIDMRHISRILDNQQPVKHEYDEFLFPIQSMLIFLCLLNNIFIIHIFQQALAFFLLSNALLLVLFGIYAEFFIGDRPSVFYTLFIAVLIHLFTIFLLFHILKTFIIIGHYQRMGKALENLQSDPS